MAASSAVGAGTPAPGDTQPYEHHDDDHAARDYDVEEHGEGIQDEADDTERDGLS
jgi:hypothetical protein